MWPSQIRENQVCVLRGTKSLIRDTKIGVSFEWDQFYPSVQGGYLIYGI
ncbi:MAG: hypothetical protein CM1200mP4_1900 [Rhodospirillaceae bacterium]|nr:MAG: hypothetical protein CM1200mP4_1900 [Rhodospirillaceae bacterium]